MTVFAPCFFPFTKLAASKVVLEWSLASTKTSFHPFSGNNGHRKSQDIQRNKRVQCLGLLMLFVYRGRDGAGLCVALAICCGGALVLKPIMAIDMGSRKSKNAQGMPKPIEAHSVNYALSQYVLCFTHSASYALSHNAPSQYVLYALSQHVLYALSQHVLYALSQHVLYALSQRIHSVMYSVSMCFAHSTSYALSQYVLYALSQLCTQSVCALRIQLCAQSVCALRTQSACALRTQSACALHTQS
ncbi:hypothetical protein Tco_1449977, partial [Tanacetum coccineum]